MITNKLIFDTLLSDIKDQKLIQITIGFNWTLVQTEFGCGLARTPKRNTLSCQPVKGSGSLTKHSVTQAAKLVKSANAVEAAIGLAAINAYYNRFDIEAADKNGLDEFTNIEGLVTVIGRFPGLTKRFKNIKVIEKEPREGEFGEKDAAQLLPKSTGVIITSSTLLNGTAGNLLELAKNSRICLIGPSTPLAPKLLNLGIDFLAGTVVKNVEKMNAVISEGGDVRSFKPFGVFKVLPNQY